MGNLIFWDFDPNLLNKYLQLSFYTLKFIDKFDFQILHTVFYNYLSNVYIYWKVCMYKDPHGYSDPYKTLNHTLSHHEYNRKIVYTWCAGNHARLCTGWTACDVRTWFCVPKYSQTRNLHEVWTIRNHSRLYQSFHCQ